MILILLRIQEERREDFQHPCVSGFRPSLAGAAAHLLLNRDSRGLRIFLFNSNPQTFVGFPAESPFRASRDADPVFSSKNAERQFDLYIG